MNNKLIIAAMTTMFTCMTSLANDSTIESSAKLTIEELRIENAMVNIPKVVNQLDETVEQFSRELSLLNQTKSNLSERLEKIIQQYGQRLWKDAAKAFHQSNNFDDRALYWARLKMTKTLRQSPVFFNTSLSKQLSLMWMFELYSRGQHDIFFDKQTNKKIILLGFDPFLLDKNIEQNNPSGVTALALDNLVVEYQGTTAEIETLIVPVRFTDFDQGMIEELLTPYMKNNVVDMVLTVSMGRKEFDLERFPALRRSATAPDNLNVYTGAHAQNPLIPMLKGKPLNGDEFIEFSLPIEAMKKAKGAYQIFDNKNVTIAAPSLSSLLNAPQNENTFPIAHKIISVQGSGGGYLSNEISYRSLRLRDMYSPSLPVGHIHTPRVKSFNVNEQQNIISQIHAMIEHAIITL
jgi:pyrrolidone-carboxylate peptidase